MVLDALYADSMRWILVSISECYPTECCRFCQILTDWGRCCLIARFIVLERALGAGARPYHGSVSLFDVCSINILLLR